MTRLTSLLPLLLLTLSACDGASTEVPEASAPEVAPAAPKVDRASAEAAALDQAQAAMGRAGKALKERLQDAMAQGGPPAAVSACADEAMGITALSAGRGARVGRASLKRRNPNNDGPDWVQAWLQEAQAKVDAGAELSSLAGVRGVAETPEGPVARVLKPIEVEGLCLNCHGSSEQISPEVATILAERYPDDAATGYAAGQLRGAIWAESPVDLGG